jgi:hypothetical protein
MVMCQLQSWIHHAKEVDELLMGIAFIRLSPKTATRQKAAIRFI